MLVPASPLPFTAVSPPCHPLRCLAVAGQCLAMPLPCKTERYLAAALHLIATALRSNPWLCLCLSHPSVPCRRRAPPRVAVPSLRQPEPSLAAAMRVSAVALPLFAVLCHSHAMLCRCVWLRSCASLCQRHALPSTSRSKHRRAMPSQRQSSPCRSRAVVCIAVALPWSALPSQRLAFHSCAIALRHWAERRYAIAMLRYAVARHGVPELCLRCAALCGAMASLRGAMPMPWQAVPMPCFALPRPCPAPLCLAAATMCLSLP